MRGHHLVAHLHLDDGNRRQEYIHSRPELHQSDALSGRDGRKLWTARQPLELKEPALDEEIVGALQWWTRGPDEPIQPYTTAETMNAGWAWRIDH